MRRTRVPLVLTVVILLAQVFRTSPLLDVVANAPARGVRLAYPLPHVVFAPFTLLADYLNAASAGELKALPLWLLLAWTLFRLSSTRHGLKHELKLLLVFLLAFSLFLWWGSRWSRPIPRAIAADSNDIVFDIHSHTSSSHDGRAGFGSAANAAWHRRAGFDAAFVTDHNVFGAARSWQLDRVDQPPRLLDGEELSLSGIHLIVLGNRERISNVPGNQSFDSTLSLIRRLAHRAPQTAHRPLLVASLPEYWRNHWGADVGRLIEAGVEGMEIWTTSPKAMEIPARHRRETIARARALGLAMFGATDMHGLGWTANVWNVAPLRGWRGLSDSALTGALIELARERPEDIRVIARYRPQPDGRLGRALSLPAGLWSVLRSASVAHAAALLVWLWGAAALNHYRKSRNDS